ncbi:hypothetical protein [Micromonospora sp. NPDC048063]|uniref:hypothetical protein n=1 Tax=Micromonospora sp. NPDC048063 TaxID=3364256 RepID=UPI003711AF27
MSIPAAADTRTTSWQRDLDEHRQVDGRCRICRTAKRCWPWATAWAALLVDQALRP